MTEVFERKRDKMLRTFTKKSLLQIFVQKKINFHQDLLETLNIYLKHPLPMPLSHYIFSILPTPTFVPTKNQKLKIHGQGNRITFKYWLIFYRLNLSLIINNNIVHISLFSYTFLMPFLLLVFTVELQCRPQNKPLRIFLADWQNLVS